MSLWRTEINVDLVSVSLPPADIWPAFQADYAGASYALVCSDATNVSVTLYLKLNMIHQRELFGPTAPNQYLTRMTAGLFVPLHSRADPYDDVTFDSSNQFQLDRMDQGVGFVAGGLLAIEKDTMTGRLSFISPVGRWDTTSSGVGTDPLTEIRPLSIGLYMQNQQDLPDFVSGSVQSIDVRFSSLAGLLDGAMITGAELTVTDPGTWNPWAESQLFAAVYTQAFTQNQYDDEALITFPGGLTPGGVPDGWYREWAGADHAPVIREQTDLAVMEAQNIVFGGWSAAPKTLTMRRSHDDGHSWTDAIVQRRTPSRSLSVQLFAGQVMVCYYDGVQIVTQQSIDFGATWSDPMPVSITGTHPRLVISPEGCQFYFYCTGTTISLARSFDFGATLFDAAPILVASPVTAQDFGAVLSADRQLVVSYIVAGTWTTRKSGDWGDSWQDA